MCGGTVAVDVAAAHGEGLSPRVRGNLRKPPGVIRRRGSIPACAGEPDGAGYQPAGNRVYPRVCGGTAGVFGEPVVGQGLSPRVRGNL